MYNKSDIKSADDFQCLSLSDQLDFKKNDTNAYLEIFKTREVNETAYSAIFSLASDIKTPDDFEKLSISEKSRFVKEHLSSFEEIHKSNIAKVSY